MKNKFAIALTALAILSAPPSRAADARTEEDFQKGMKEIMGVMKTFKANMESQNSEAIAEGAHKVAEIYKKDVAFWKARKVDDAAKWSAESADGAEKAAAAAKAKDWDKVKTSWGSVGKNCKSCHEAHREQLPDKSYKIK